MLPALTVAVGWLVLTVVGIAVLAPAAPDVKRRLLIFAPVLGAALLSSVLHWTALLVPVPAGLAGVVLVLAGCLVVAQRRGRLRWRWTRAEAVLISATTAIGVAAAVLSQLPAMIAGSSRAMSVSGNRSMDAIFYVSEADWLRQQRIWPRPTISELPGEGALLLAHGPASAAIDRPVRMGQPMVHATIDTVLGADAADTLIPLLGLWVLLVAVATAGAARLLGARWWVALLAGAAGGFSSPLLQQVYNQNSDSLLGVSLAIASVAVGVLAARQWRFVLPAALLLAGTAAVYTEYLVFVLPALGAAVLLARKGTRVGAFKRAAAAGAVAVVISPFAWYRGARTMLLGLRGGDQDDRSSWFAHADPWVSIGRALGTEGFYAGSSFRWLTLVALVAAVAALVAALLLRRRDGWLYGLLLFAALYVGYLTLAQRGYSQQRAVILLVPLVLVAVALGWEAIAARVRWHPRVVVAAVLVATVPVIGVNAAVASTDFSVDFAERQQYDEDFDEAVSWVEERGGKDVLVASPDFFEQLWLAYGMRTEPDTSFADVNSTYLRRDTFWDGEPRRYLLVGSGAAMHADPAAVVASNDRFVMLDTEAGDVVVAVPGQGTWAAHADESPAPTGQNGGAFLVLASPSLAGDYAVRLEPANEEGRTDWTIGSSTADLAATVEVPLSGSGEVSMLAVDAPASAALRIAEVVPAS